MRSSEPPLVESVSIPDIFASGLAFTEHLAGGCMRFTFYADQKSVTTGEMERIVVSRIVAPAAAVQRAVEMAIQAIGGVPVYVADDLLRKGAH